jgi:ParB family transcriptional regulator, chromosome partitioning protein
VRISMGARKGKLQIEFGSVDDLERIVGVIADGLGGRPGEANLSAPDLSGAEVSLPPPGDDRPTVEVADLDERLDELDQELADLDELDDAELDALTRPEG